MTYVVLDLRTARYLRLHKGLNTRPSTFLCDVPKTVRRWKPAIISARFIRTWKPINPLGLRMNRRETCGQLRSAKCKSRHITNGTKMFGRNCETAGSIFNDFPMTKRERVLWLQYEPPLVCGHVDRNFASKLSQYRNE